MNIDTVMMGNRIRERRENLQITREQLAEILDITTKFYCDIETGARGMSLKTLMKLSKTLYVSTDYILFGEKNDTAKTSFTLFAESIPEKHSDYYLRLCNEAKQLSEVLRKSE